MRLFDEATLRKLEQLSLSADSVRVGAMKGDRRSRKRGTAIEFADYRDYTQGDDLRRLDWNVFARLERPFIKTTEEEEDLAVHILVDTSASMLWPLDDDQAEQNKLRYAMRLAGSLGLIGLTSGDFVTVALIDSSGQRAWGPFRGRQNTWPMIQFLEAAHTKEPPTGPIRKTALDVALRHYAQSARRPGLLFLLSDLLSAADVRPGLTALLTRGHEVVLLHILSPDEIAPELFGDLKLIDIETGELAEVTIDPPLLEAYRSRLDAWQSDIRQFCQQRSVHYTNISTGVPWERVIHDTLRRQRVVR